MLLLFIITYLALFLQILFATIAIAAALYYLAELVEEYTVLSKKVIWWMNLTTLILYIGLWLLEGFPTILVMCGILAQLSHFVILQNFPYVSFLSPGFLVAIAFVFINHYLCFQYFGQTYYTFSEVMGYCTLFLWMVPFALFISLSANENVLPTTRERRNSDTVSHYFSKRNKKYGLLSLFDSAKETLLPNRTRKVF